MSILVFWGHHVDEYREMFDLKESDLTGKILEFGSGPSAVNAELAGIAQQRISCDPLFNLDYDTLKAKSGLVFANMVEKMIENPGHYDFSNYTGQDAFFEHRQAGMVTFFSDYNQGKQEGRYVGINDIQLPFEDFSFDLALSSHYLFSQLEDQTIEFHVALLQELARVAREVRIFPLIDGHEKPSPLLGPVLLALQQAHYGTEIRAVPYHLEPQGNALLRIWANVCPVPI